MNSLPDNRKMPLSLHNAKVLIDIHGTHELTVKRLTLHNRIDRSYCKWYMNDTKFYRFLMTMVDEG